MGSVAVVCVVVVGGVVEHVVVVGVVVVVAAGVPVVGVVAGGVVVEVGGCSGCGSWGGIVGGTKAQGSRNRIVLLSCMAGASSVHRSLIS